MAVGGILGKASPLLSNRRLFSCACRRAGLLSATMENGTSGIVPEIRLLTADDDVAALTKMLHRAYRPLAEQGMRFIASTACPLCRWITWPAPTSKFGGADFCCYRNPRFARN